MKQFAGFYFDFRGGRTADDYFRNQHGVLNVGRHVCMFVVDDVIVRIGSSLNFHRDKDLFLSSSKNSDRVHKRFDLIEVIT